MVLIKHAFLLAMRLTACLGMVAALVAHNPIGATAQAPANGIIAYVTADTRDEIRLVDPDGRNDRRLWLSPVDDPQNAYDVWSLAWQPDGSQLVFNSSHEGWCSLNNADIFTIHADGTGYRRITEAPACADLAGYPQGTVEVPVTNSTFDSFTGFVYFQGASSAEWVSLQSGGSRLVTFDQVADFGDEALQIAGFIQGTLRISVVTAVDVQAVGVSGTAELEVWEISPYATWEAHSPTWRYGSEQIAYVFNWNTVRQITTNPTPLDFGSNLLAVEQSAMPDFVSHLAYGPTQATATQLLYAGGSTFAPEAIYRVTEGSDTPGEPLVSYDFGQQILGLAWLPDGSGFVYSVKEFTYTPRYVESANLFVHTFAAGEATRLTDFSGEFTGRMAVSPDGQRVVFEQGAEMNQSLEVMNADLWMVHLDGSGLELFLDNARSPAWSRGQPAPSGELPPVFYVPLVGDILSGARSGTRQGVSMRHS